MNQARDETKWRRTPSEVSLTSFSNKFTKITASDEFLTSTVLIYFPKISQFLFRVVILSIPNPVQAYPIPNYVGRWFPCSIKISQYIMLYTCTIMMPSVVLSHIYKIIFQNFYYKCWISSTIKDQQYKDWTILFSWFKHVFLIECVRLNLSCEVTLFFVAIVTQDLSTEPV